MTVAEKVLEVMRESSAFNADVQIAPTCILWPDHERIWEGAIPSLQEQLPELFVYGSYDPEHRSGPAIWLRCVIARKLEGVTLSDKAIPILYLPGVSRSDLRAIDSCIAELKPIAELQYRGAIWSHPNGRDWTPQAFLKAHCGIEVAGDNTTKASLPRAIDVLLDEDIAALRGKHLDASYFNQLILGDSVRNLLAWIDNSEAFRARHCDSSWQAFIETCKTEFSIDPTEKSHFDAAYLLAEHEGVWRAVWDRYCEAPERYPNIREHIRKCEMPSKTDFFVSDECYEGWPQWNSEKEKELLQEIIKLSDFPAERARARILALEESHGSRRGLVWARLGESPLAASIEYLAKLAEATRKSITAVGFPEIETGYLDSGWVADDAMLHLLACRCRNEERTAIEAAARAIYFPWIDESARRLQDLAVSGSYPLSRLGVKDQPAYEDDQCLVFVDGLRLDLGKRLSTLLINRGLLVSETPVWSALPTVTATAKPAVSPIRQNFNGADISADFEPGITMGSKVSKGTLALRKALDEAGWQVLDSTSNGSGKGHAWCEVGEIDKQGHDNGKKLATAVDDQLDEVAERIKALCNAGWSSVRVVTDHGWLLMPGGLPRINLPSDLTANKWGRCAALKEGARSDEMKIEWFWNPVVSFAMAEGVSCFYSNVEYAHGGLSLQECLTIQLTVSKPKDADSLFKVRIAEVTWLNQRCRVSVEGVHQDLVADLRLQPGNQESSLLPEPVKLASDGFVTFVIEDDSKNGKSASVVLLDPKGNVVAQAKTSVAGG